MDEKSATRDRILQAAMTRIKHYGYGKTTMAEIAADCDMSPGNIYRFFEAKIDIAEAIRHSVRPWRRGLGHGFSAGRGCCRAQGADLGARAGRRPQHQR